MRQFLCPSCSAVNRAPDGADLRQAKCGRCHARIFEGRPVEVSGAQFAAHRASTQGVALLLDVWAPWCGPCRAMAPAFATAATRLEPEARLLKLNSDENPQVAAELGVRGIPALFLIRDGHVAAQSAGVMSADQLVAWTRQSLATA